MNKTLYANVVTTSIFTLKEKTGLFQL